MSEEHSCNPFECPVGRRLEKIEEKLQTLSTNDALQDSKYDMILTRLTEVTNEVKSLKEAPGDNWRNLVKTVLSTVATIVVGFALAKIF